MTYCIYGNILIYLLVSLILSITIAKPNFHVDLNEVYSVGTLVASASLDIIIGLFKLS